MYTVENLESQKIHIQENKITLQSHHSWTEVLMGSVFL